MSAILGPDGMPVTREKGAFGPPSLDAFPTYEEGHWNGLQEAAKALYDERMTVMLSTPMALLRADFISLAVNVKRLREENARLRSALKDVIEAASLDDTVKFARALAEGGEALNPAVQDSSETTE